MSKKLYIVSIRSCGQPWREVHRTFNHANALCSEQKYLKEGCDVRFETQTYEEV